MEMPEIGSKWVSGNYGETGQVYEVVVIAAKHNAIDHIYPPYVVHRNVSNDLTYVHLLSVWHEKMAPHVPKPKRRCRYNWHEEKWEDVYQFSSDWLTPLMEEVQWRREFHRVHATIRNMPEKKSLALRITHALLKRKKENK